MSTGRQKFWSLRIWLYGLDVCALDNRSLQSLDFTVNRFFMKLFRTSDIAVVRECQSVFGFDAPSVALAKRFDSFVGKFTSGQRCLWVVSSVKLVFCVFFYLVRWIKMNILNCQRRQCSAMTLDSGNIRIVRLFPAVPWRVGVKRQWGNQKRRLRTLRLRHLRKWGQHYYIVLFSPLSPFYWPQNTWHWMTFNGLKCHFTL